MQFSDTSNKQGIVEDIDFFCDTDSTTYPTAQKTRNVNRAYDRVVSLILGSDGRWQWDDTNATDLPIATTTITANQQDYGIDTTHLKITRVEIKDSAGNWILLNPIDAAEVTDQSISDFYKTAGLPIYYDKIANSIFLYPKPNYTQAASLKVYFQRNVSYFTASDTTKQPGFASPFHRLLSLGASFDFALKKGLPQLNSLREQIAVMEQALMDFYAQRPKDERIGLTARGRTSNAFK